jgi:uncharacterized membrane protein YkvA (DUF1232 family)
MPLTITFQLSDRDLDHLGEVMNKAKAKASALGENEVIGAARALLEESKDIDVPDFIRERMESLHQLIQMVEDPVWKLSGDDRERITNALAYFADPDDIIPDNVPGFGLLDDAVVIELVCQSLRHDIEAYQDFCKFREAEEKRRGKSIDPLSPEQWLQTRRTQLHERMRRRRSTLWERRLGGRRGPPSTVII